MRSGRLAFVGLLIAAAAATVRGPAAMASTGSGDYIVTATSGLYEAPPAGATAVPLSGPYYSTQVTAPFPIPYWGVLYNQLWVTRTGFVQFGVPQGADQWSDGQMSNVHATDQWDGMCAPYWAGIGYGTIYTWTAGTAPNRRFIVSWENFYNSSTTGEHLYFQVRFLEGSGKIQFAYRPDTTPSTWNDLFDYYNSGMVAPGSDPRWIATTTDSTIQHLHPAADYEFSPRLVRCTGTLLFDRIVPTASGVPSTASTDVPLAGVRLELRYPGGAVNASTLTGTDGTFDLPGMCGLAPATADVWAVASSASCVVLGTGQSAPAGFRIAAGVSLATDTALGTKRITASSDANATFRAPASIASAVQRAYAWAAPLTTDAIPGIVVNHDTTSTAVTGYTGGPTPSLRVAGPAAANPDTWDDPVIIRAYARHLLASIAAPQTATQDPRLDAVTDAQNAFAEGFACYVRAAVSGSGSFVDGIDATTATTFELEDPQPASRKGPDVAAWVAAGLYDLLDPMNESWDGVDGSGASGLRPFQAVDSLTTVPTIDWFYKSWAVKWNAAGLSRVLIHHGLVADDASEPNDSAGETASLGTVGVRRDGLVLNVQNEDWFTVTLPAAADALVADATYDRTLNTVVEVEIRDAVGALLATGSGVGATGPMRAAAGTLPAGTYRVVVRSVAGAVVPTYTAQCFVPLAMDAAPLRDWTVGRPYDQPLGVVGGIAPFVLTTVGSALPPGLAFSPLNQHAVGTPTTRGSFHVTTLLRDNGNPASVVTGSQTVTIHDALKVATAEFVGFPVGRAIDTVLPTTGGTPPLTLGVTSGGLPGGLVIDPTSFRVTGTATAGPSSAFELDGVDVAGSADHVATRGVVAPAAAGKNVPADLVAGIDACGWWFDAVRGSKVSFTAATAKKRAKRTLVGAVLAPDRSLVLTGKIKTKPGSLTGSGMVCPLSGRYYVIASSDTGDATQFLCNVKVAPPKLGKAKIPVFAPSDTTTVEVGAVPGAVLTLKFAGQKKTTLVAKIVGVTDPTGAPVGTAQFVKATATGGTLTMTLPTGGTWTFVLGATSTSGVPGKLSYSYTIKQPKGVTYSAD